MIPTKNHPKLVLSGYGNSFLNMLNTTEPARTAVRMSLTDLGQFKYLINS